MLNIVKHQRHGLKQFGPLHFGHVHAYGRIEFVHGAESLYAQAVLFGAAAVAQAGGAVITGARIYFCKSIAHGPDYRPASHHVPLDSAAPVPNFVDKSNNSSRVKLLCKWTN